MMLTAPTGEKRGRRTAIARADLATALKAWRQIAASEAQTSDDDVRVIKWLRTVWELGAIHIPLPFVQDLGFILLRGRGFSFRQHPEESQSSDDSDDHENGSDNDNDDDADGDNEAGLGRRTAAQRRVEEQLETKEAQRRRSLAYQDRVVGQWIHDATLFDLHVYVAGLDVEMQDRVIAHALFLTLAARLDDVDSLFEGNPAHLRALKSNEKSSTSTEGPQGSTEGRREDATTSADDVVDDAWLNWAHDSLADAVASLASVSQLLSPEDQWELTHLQVLPSESTRLALRQIHHVSGAIGPLSAREVLSMRQKAREVAIEDVDAANYPTGGFDAISTQGSFENLVRTEIGYVGEGADDLDGIDLFDVRFVESELLYYTRDESPALDVHRKLDVVIDESERTRFKHPRHSAQTGVLVLGLAVALQADMIRAFGAHASFTTIRMHPRSDADLVAALEDADTLRISLQSEILHQRAAVEVLPLSDGDTDSLLQCRGVVFSLRPRPTNATAFAWIRIDDEDWIWERKGGAKFAFEISRPESLRRLADALLFALVSGRDAPSIFLNAKEKENQ